MSVYHRLIVPYANDRSDVIVFSALHTKGLIIDSRRHGCQVAAPHPNWGSVHSEEFIVRRTRSTERNLHGPDGSPEHSSKWQTPGAGKRLDEHDRRTRRRTGVALRRTPYGGQGCRRPASPVTGTAVVPSVTVTRSYPGSSSPPDGLPTPLVVPTRAGGSHVSVRPPALSRPVHYERATGEDTLAVFTPAGSNPEWVRPASIGRWKTTTGRSARRFERSAPVRE